MREATMSPELFVSGATKQERARPADPNSRQPAGWDPEGFAQEQIRGLVRQVFLSNPERSVRQVVFSAAEPETDVQNLCWRAAEALAQETTESIALAGTYSQALPDANARRNRWPKEDLRDSSAGQSVACVACSERRRSSDDCMVAILHGRSASAVRVLDRGGTIGF